MNDIPEERTGDSAASPNQNEYGADSIKVLKGPFPVRKTAVSFLDPWACAGDPATAPEKPKTAWLAT